MKLDWRINNCRVLVAEAGAVTYYVAPDVISLWKPKKYSTVSEGKVEAEGAVYGMSLTNAIAWCERDAERPEECPVQPPAADPVAPKMSGEMSGEMSKFPSTMDAEEWGVGAAKGTGGDWTCAKILKDWFQAALSFAYVRGSEETLEKQKLAERANPVAPLNSFDARVWAKEFMRIHRSFITGMVQADEETMVGWFSNALMRGYDEHRWKMDRENPPAGPTLNERLSELSDKVDRNLRDLLLKTDQDISRVMLRYDQLQSRLGLNTMPPSTQVPEPPSVEDRLARLEARQEAEDRAGLVAQLPGLYDKVGRLSLELCMLPVDRLRDMARRIAELETKQKADDEIRFNQIQALSLRASSDEIKMSGGFERLKRRLDGLEAKLPRTGDASLGTMHEEVCKRLGDLEERAQWSPDSRLVEDRLKELGAEVAAHERSLSFHAKRLEKLEVKA